MSIVRIESGTSVPVPSSPIPLAITSLTKNALPPVTARSSARRRVGPPGQLEEVADGVVVERADVDAGQLAVAGEAHQQAVELGVRRPPTGPAG